MNEANEIPFSYHREMRPILWVLLGASAVEMAVVHLVVALFWSVHAALWLFALSLIGVALLIGFARSLEKLPILVTNDGISVYLGWLIRQHVPFDRIESAAPATDLSGLKRPGLLKACIFAPPSVMLNLTDPVMVGRHRKVTAIALRPDDASGFLAAVALRLEQAKAA